MNTLRLRISLDLAPCGPVSTARSFPVSFPLSLAAAPIAWCTCCSP